MFIYTKSTNANALFSDSGTQVPFPLAKEMAFSLVEQAITASREWCDRCPRVLEDEHYLVVRPCGHTLCKACACELIQRVVPKCVSCLKSYSSLEIATAGLPLDQHIVDSDENIDKERVSAFCLEGS